MPPVRIARAGVTTATFALLMVQIKSLKSPDFKKPNISLQSSLSTQFDVLTKFGDFLMPKSPDVAISSKNTYHFLTVETFRMLFYAFK